MGLYESTYLSSVMGNCWRWVGYLRDIPDTRHASSSALGGIISCESYNIIRPDNCLVSDRLVFFFSRSPHRNLKNRSPSPILRWVCPTKSFVYWSLSSSVALFLVSPRLINRRKSSLRAYQNTWALSLLCAHPSVLSMSPFPKSAQFEHLGFI